MAKENRFKKLLAETSAEVKELNLAKMPDNVAPKKENKEMTNSLNPLKSGHCSWMQLNMLKLLKIELRLNPLKSGHCSWIY